MKKNYDAIRENIINNFLVRNYLWTCVSRKEALFNDMKDRSPFPFTYDYEKDVLLVCLGNNINISFNFIWEIGEEGKGHKHHLIKIT